jgi:hypothetical protein
MQTVEVRPEAQAAYNAMVQRRLQGTVWMTGCKSWYLAANGRNTTLWPGFTWEYRLRTRRFDAANYTLTRGPGERSSADQGAPEAVPAG